MQKGFLCAFMSTGISVGVLTQPAACSTIFDSAVKRYNNDHYAQASLLFRNAQPTGHYWIAKCLMMQRQVEAARKELKKGLDLKDDVQERKLCLNALAKMDLPMPKRTESLNRLALSIQGRIGIGLNGPKVVDIVKGAAADKAGIKIGDTVIKIDGYPAAGTVADEAVLLARGIPDSIAKITVSRNGKIHNFDVKRYWSDIDGDPNRGQHSFGVSGWSSPVLLPEDRKRVEFFVRRIPLDPDCSMPWMDRGNLYYQVGLHGKARAEYNHGLQIDTRHIRNDPFNFEPWWGRAMTFTEAHDYKDSLNDWNVVEKLGSVDNHFYYHRSEVYDIIGNKRQADRDRKKDRELNPDDYKTGDWLTELEKELRPKTKPPTKKDKKD